MKNKIKFEEAIDSLEHAVNRLESGKLPLDEAISVYEEAIALIKVCHTHLEDAKGRIRILTEAPDGTVTDTDFASPDET